MSRAAIVDAAIAVLAAPTPSTDGNEADIRVDGSGRLWVRPSTVPGAQAIASTAYTVDVNTAAITVPDGASKINIFIDITVVGADADEVLDISVEWSPDLGTTWHTADPADTFTQILQTAGAQRVAKQFDVLAPTYRLALDTAGSTPEFTFAIDHVGVYA